MNNICFAIRVLSAVLCALFGVFLFLPALLISFLALIFNGNFIGMIMILMSAFVFFSAYLCIRSVFKDRNLAQSDPVLYRKNEMKASVFSIFSALIILFVLFVYNQNLSGIIEYGFGMIFAAAVVLLAVNVVSLALSATKKNS